MSDGELNEATGSPGAADLVEIFYAPRAVFARRQEGSFGLPLVALVVTATVLAIATSNLTQPAVHGDLVRGLQPSVAAGKFTADQVTAMVATQEKLAFLGAPVFFLVAPFVSGIVIWLAGFATRVRVGLGQAVMIGTFSLFPKLVGMVVGAVIALLSPEGTLTSATKLTLSPAQFVNVAAHPALATLLTRVDVFVFWSYALVGIGLLVIARATRAQAWITAIIAWLVLSLPAVLGALRAQ